MQSFKQYLLNEKSELEYDWNDLDHFLPIHTIKYAKRIYPHVIKDMKFGEFNMKIHEYIMNYSTLQLTDQEIKEYKTKYPKLVKVPNRHKFAYRGLFVKPSSNIISDIIDTIHKKYNTITHESTVNEIKFDGILQNFVYKDDKKFQSWTVNENVAWNFAGGQDHGDKYKAKAKKTLKSGVQTSLYVINDIYSTDSKISIQDVKDYIQIPCILEAYVDNSFFMNPYFMNQLSDDLHEYEVLRASNKPLKCNLWIPAQIVERLKKLLDKIDSKG